MTSNKMQKTVAVAVSRTVQHPRYKKIVKMQKTYYAHNILENVEIGTKVRIQETRPLSKLKRWIVTEVIA